MNCSTMDVLPTPRAPRTAIVTRWTPGWRRRMRWLLRRTPEADDDDDDGGQGGGGLEHLTHDAKQVDITEAGNHSYHRAGKIGGFRNKIQAFKAKFWVSVILETKFRFLGFISFNVWHINTHKSVSTVGCNIIFLPHIWSAVCGEWKTWRKLRMSFFIQIST